MQLSIFDLAPSQSVEEQLFEAALKLLPRLRTRQPLDSQILRSVMSESGGSDVNGQWDWKDAYEAVEVALVLWLKRQTKQWWQQESQSVLAELQQVQNLCPTQSKRSQDSVRFQQFSTPLPLAYLASLAANLRPREMILEPSAGTGLLAAFCQEQGAKLLLNELCPIRAALLKQTFPGVPVFTYNAEQIDDYLPQKYQPTVVVMNPPFTASPQMLKRNPYATYQHLKSALGRLPSGGRLVAITANWFSPLHPDWQELFSKLTRTASIVFSVGIAGKVYAKQGTNIETRLTVIDKERRESGHITPEILGDLAELLKLIESIPPRCQIPVRERRQPEKLGWQELPLFKLTTIPHAPPVPVKLRITPPETEPTSGQSDWQPTIELEYHTKDWAEPGEGSSGGLYEPYQPQTIHIPGAAAHPTPLVQSTAMAAVTPPKPTYRPQLPARLLTAGILSAAQIESLIYAGEAHSKFLSGYYRVDEHLEQVSPAPEGEGVQFRRGWFLGDGTGCGKGRQVAAIILDNWLQGRRKALWISKSDKLVEDARRDWQALGGTPEQVVPLSRFRQGEEITISEGIIFLTYATLRTQERQGKQSRVQQLLGWCGADFEGAIVFDESHAMANAAAVMGSRGLQAPSQQGLAGLRLQYGLPQARVLYVSATGATTVHNLAYATRLGLWGSQEFPFASRSDFIGAMEKGGIAAMEVVCRDLKSLGLYCSRCLSYDGIDYQILEHELTPEQIRIYDSYAAAFHIIHQNIEAALEATNITSVSGKCRNSQAKAAARSAFESNKQRFFNHLLTAMKCPTLIRAIEHNLEAGQAVVVQLVSTNEALLERRLADIPTSEWDDLEIDITPREYVLDYLRHSFPIHLHQVYTDENGNEYSQLATDEDGDPIICQSALAQREQLIEQLALLPPLPGALDTLVQHFGTENVAEVTGRSKRIIRQTVDGRDVLSIQKRPATANLDETQAFMDDRKPILIFSDAGGTGRSYHADLGAKNQRLRVHYLLESGWKADTAIQGLGRSNRTNQKQPPVFRPLTTNVKGEKRFISTIARRLDSLGALTRGQRQTGGQGLFNEDDNLESLYARAALTDFFHSLYHNRIPNCTLNQFENLTGLSLSQAKGGLKQELPAIGQFLNRLLALPISLQNDLFDQFELRLESRIETAIASGTYEVGVEMLHADSFRVLKKKVIYTHSTGAQTTCCHIEQRDKTKILSWAEANALRDSKSGHLLENRLSRRVALALPTNSLLGEDGEIIERVKLLRPTTSEKVSQLQLATSTWQEVSAERFQSLWQAEVSQAPTYTTKTFYLITGLLLPIWDRLDSENLRIWSLTADNGERLLGRLVDAEGIQSVYQQLGIDAKVQLSPSEIFTAVTERGAVLPLNRWWLRSSRVMGHRRLELTHFQPGEVDWLKAAGCFSELISWQLRLFIPLNQAATIIAKLIRVDS